MTQAPPTDSRRADWQHHIDQWQSSGLSGAEYCRQHELTYHCFIYWRSQFFNAVAEPPSESPASDRALSAFVTVQTPLQCGLAETKGDDLYLHLPNGLEIRNIHCGNLTSVRALLEQL